jgi:hypothetical protein
MAGNTTPIWSRVADDQWITLATANTALDGTGTVAVVFTADATNGGYASVINLEHLGTNIATVLRIFENNGSTNTTAANNILRYEVTMPANTLSQVAASIPQIITVNRALPPGYRFLATVGTTIAAGIGVSVSAGKY